MWFTRVSIQNPIFATMMMVAILILGIFSYQKLPVQQFPNMDLPSVIVTTEYPNASPKAVEHDVTEKIENAMNTLSGIDTITSKSYQGQSIVIVKFNLNTDANVDEEHVREQLGIVQADFNENVGTPSIKQIDPDAQPIISLSVTSSKRSLKEVSNWVENLIVKRIQDVQGVGQVNVVGERVRQVNIEIEPKKLIDYHLNLNDIVTALQNDSQDFPVGTLKGKTTEINIQLQNSLKRIPDFGKIVIGRHGNQPVHLNEVAQIVDGMADATSAAFIDGKPTVAIDILKTDDANTVAVAKLIKARVALLSQDLPSDIHVSVVKDNARGILASLNNVKETIIEGAILTILVVFLFLSSWRSTVITSLTLPISVVGSFIAMAYFGFSLNNFTLMALSLSIGILIDDAIVVRENITRHLVMGEDHYHAALKGTKEIGLAVLATTSTLIAVFLPVAYMDGMIGKMFFEFGITVSISVIISLFVSYTLDPMLSSVWNDPSLVLENQPKWLQKITLWREAHLDTFTEKYQAILHWCLENRKKTLIGTSMVFLASFLLMNFIGKEFMPNADLGEISILATAPERASLDYTSGKVMQMQKMLKTMPDVDYSYAVVNTSTAQGENNAAIFVELKKHRQYSAKVLMDMMRKRLSSVAGMEIMVGNSDASGRVQRGIQVNIRGDNLDKLQEYAEGVEKIMHTIPGVVDIDSSLKPDKPVIDLIIRRDVASDLGVNPAAIYDALQPLFSTKMVGTWLAPDDNNYDVVIQLSPKSRELLQNVHDISIPSNNIDKAGNVVMVPLTQLVEIKEGNMPSMISHYNLKRQVVVSANAQGVSEGTASLSLFKKVQSMQLPQGYSLGSEGNSKKMAESAGYAGSSLILGIIFIYIILASQFASFLQPLVIMASLPLSLIGVFIALFLTGGTLNMFSAIGCIMLMGLVTKNAILLVDFANVAMRAGTPRIQALMEAGKIRMRPILMTTLAMIMGMLPLSLGIGEGAEQRMSMAQAIIGGIITSTILTLVVIPVIYTYVDDWSKKALAYFKHK